MKSVSRSESTPRDGPCISSRKTSNNSIRLAASGKCFWEGNCSIACLPFLHEAKVDGRGRAEISAGHPRDKSRAKNMETGNVPDDRDGDDERDQDVAGHFG